MNVQSRSAMPTEVSVSKKEKVTTHLTTSSVIAPEWRASHYEQVFPLLRAPPLQPSFSLCLCSTLSGLCCQVSSQPEADVSSTMAFSGRELLRIRTTLYLERWSVHVKQRFQTNTRVFMTEISNWQWDGAEFTIYRGCIIKRDSRLDPLSAQPTHRSDRIKESTSKKPEKPLYILFFY